MFLHNHPSSLASKVFVGYLLRHVKLIGWCLWHVSLGPCESGQKQAGCFQLSSGSSSSEDTDRLLFLLCQAETACLEAGSLPPSELLLLPKMDWMVKLEIGAAAGQHLLGSSLLLILDS